MIVVSDTSPLTSLLTVDRLEILQELFASVLIPDAVRDELVRYHASLPDFVVVQSPANEQQVAELAEIVDRGEAEAIVLAQEVHADLLLIDERLGRSVATGRGLHVIGLLGVLLLAKRRGLLASVADIIGQIERRAGFHISAELRKLVLEQAGEA